MDISSFWHPNFPINNCIIFSVNIASTLRETLMRKSKNYIFHVSTRISTFSIRYQFTQKLILNLHVCYPKMGKFNFAVYNKFSLRMIVFNYSFKMHL